MLLRNKHIRQAPAFTLIELIIVMAVLATVLAIVVPSLVRSFQERHLGEEADRLLALIEYGRDEATSQGVPMVIWIDSEKGDFGLDAATGYTASQASIKQYSLEDGVRFDSVKSSANTKDGHAIFVQFSPDGSPDPSDVDSVRIVDRSNSSLALARTTDGWDYEIIKEESNGSFR
jgi:type II secretion system protein H